MLGLGCTSVVEHVPSIDKALGQIPINGNGKLLHGVRDR